MPTDSLLVAIGVCLIFLAFAIVLAWVDHRTSQWLRDRAAAAPATVTTEHRHHEAA